MIHYFNATEEEYTPMHALRLGLSIGEPKPTQCQTVNDLRGRRIVGIYGPDWDDTEDENELE